MASLGRLLDSQGSSGDRDDDGDADSVSGSRPSSFDHGQLSSPDVTTTASSVVTTTAIVNANGSVPRSEGAENEAFDAGANEDVFTS